jgi:hypothetical protein
MGRSKLSEEESCWITNLAAKTTALWAEWWCVSFNWIKGLLLQLSRTEAGNSATLC